MKIGCIIKGDTTTVTLEGNLSEESEQGLLELRSQIKTPKVVFDVAGVKHINSYGVLRWMGFVRDVGAKAQLEFHRCPINFIEYCGMLRGFLGGGQAVSMLITFCCQRCEALSVRLLDCATVQAQGVLPEAACVGCGGRTRPDLDIGSLTHFLI